MLRFSKSSIEDARTELAEFGGYIEPMPLGVADDDCFYSIGGGFGTGLWVERETYYGMFRYPFSGDFDKVIADLYAAIKGGEFDD